MGRGGGYLTNLNGEGEGVPHKFEWGGGGYLTNLNGEGEGVPHKFEWGGGGYLTNLNGEGEGVPHKFEWGGAARAALHHRHCRELAGPSKGAGLCHLMSGGLQPERRFRLLTPPPPGKRNQMSLQRVQVLCVRVDVHGVCAPTCLGAPDNARDTVRMAGLSDPAQAFA